MKQLIILILTAQLALLAGCASTPEENKQITSLERDIQSLQATGEDKRYAPVAVQEAQEAIDKLRELAQSGADQEAYEHQLYIAKRQVDIAREMVTMKKAQETVANADLRRQKILLQAERQQVQNVQERADKMTARAQELEQQMQNVQTKETERGLVLALGSVLFETGEATLSSGSRRTVEKVAGFLNDYPEREILIEGFADATGDENFNLQLSQQRAQAVKRALVDAGVEPSRVKTEGYGENFPVASNETAAGRQENRRVEVVIGNANGDRIEQRTTMR